jgi:hypothetical protein
MQFLPLISIRNLRKLIILQPQRPSKRRAVVSPAHVFLWAIFDVLIISFTQHALTLVLADLRNTAAYMSLVRTLMPQQMYDARNHHLEQFRLSH